MTTTTAPAVRPRRPVAQPNATIRPPVRWRERITNPEVREAFARLERLGDERKAARAARAEADRALDAAAVQDRTDTAAALFEDKPPPPSGRHTAAASQVLADVTRAADGVAQAYAMATRSAFDALSEHRVELVQAAQAAIDADVAAADKLVGELDAVLRRIGDRRGDLRLVTDPKHRTPQEGAAIVEWKRELRPRVEALLAAVPIPTAEPSDDE